MSGRDFDLRSQGPHVEALQHALIRRGFPLPVYGPDGDLGPETWAALAAYCEREGIDWDVPAHVVEALMPAVVGPVEFQPKGPRIDRIPGCWFSPGDPNTSKRAEPICSVVLHWTGGRGKAAQVYRTLSSRRLSIHYVIEPSGRVVQMADHGTQCAHVGPANPFSIGIECVSLGYDRNQPKTRFLGHGYRLAIWPKAQIEAAAGLVEHICAEHDIPRVYPSQRRDVAADFEGVMGHFHTHATKTDPGPAPFEALRAAGFREVD